VEAKERASTVGTASQRIDGGDPALRIEATLEGVILITYVLTGRGSDVIADIQETMERVPDPATVIGNGTFSGTPGESLVVAGTGRYTLDLADETIALDSQNLAVTAPFFGMQPLGPVGQHLAPLEPVRMLGNADVVCD
jgi:hypothetical protein